MTRILAISIVLLASSAILAKDPPTYRWLREIKLPPIEATIVVGVPLDSHFFQSTRDNSPDVRLRNDKGEVVAYLIRPAQEMKTRTIRQFWSAEKLSAKVQADTGLQVEFAVRPKDPVPSGIRIVTPLRDFEHQIQIESSADGETWRPAGSPTVIFDYSRYVDARNDLVPLNAGTDRHFRISVLDPTAEQESQFLELHRRLSGDKEVERNEQTLISRRPFRIDRIEFYHDHVSPEKSEPRTTVYPAADFLVLEDAKKQQSILTFSSQREPITQIRILTDAENFSRAAAVEAEVEDNNGKRVWRSIRTGTLTRIDVGTVHRSELKLTFSEQQSHRYRVLIDNHDSPPLAITGVELSGPIDELTFLASPGQKIFLEYGSSDSLEGHYDTAALREALGQVATVPQATMEAERENPKAMPDHGRSWTPWNDTRVLIAVIIGATGLLGWGLFQAGKRVTSSAPPGDS